MRKTVCWVALAVLTGIAAAPTWAQQEQEPAAAAHGHHAEAAAHEHHHGEEAAMPAADGFKSSVLGMFDREASKLVALAEATPAEKYGWRPGEGVRSTSEVFMHVALANYFLSQPLGRAMPEGISREMEQESDRGKVIASLEESIAHARAAIEGTAWSDLGAGVEIFGQQMTKGDVVLILLGHAEEHLGQSIAYARVNGIVPPWSQPPPAAEGEEAAEGAEDAEGGDEGR